MAETNHDDQYRYLPECHYCGDRVILIVNRYGLWSRERWEHVGGDKICKPIRVATPKEPEPPPPPEPPLPRKVMLWMLFAFLVGRRKRL